MKKVSKVLVLGVALTAMGATANAATIDFNVYGASAQFTFWNAAAPGFLTSIRGCAAFSQLRDSTGKHEITQGTGCDGGANTINIRYSSKASYDGIKAAAASAVGDCPGQAGQRQMITAIGDATLSCQPIHVGASDVGGAAFTQSSDGMPLGPMGGTANLVRIFNGVPTTGLAAPARPVVVPFGFFANAAIQVSKCSGGEHDGNLCTVGTILTDCGTKNVLAPGVTCSAKTLDNITREMAVQIFGGSAQNWTDFGASYSVAGSSAAYGNAVIACLRHAGSGTHSTIDKVFFTGAKPNALVSTENIDKAFGQIAYFNDGSADEINCVNGDTPTTTTFTCNAVQAGTSCTVATQGTDCVAAVPPGVCKSYNNGQAWGAIGYADSDQATGVVGVSNNVVPIKYNGMFGRRNVIRNGAYDFFANQNLYLSPSNAGSGTDQATLFNALVTYASDPANIPSSKAAYWATSAEMNFNKTSDTSYPVYKAATKPQTP